MTTKPSEWAMREVEKWLPCDDVEHDPGCICDRTDIAMALDAAFARGKAEGRREVVESIRAFTDKNQKAYDMMRTVPPAVFRDLLFLLDEIEGKK